jgi:hypothetical protein
VMRADVHVRSLQREGSELYRLCAQW